MICATPGLRDLILGLEQLLWIVVRRMQAVVPVHAGGLPRAASCESRTAGCPAPPRGGAQEPVGRLKGRWSGGPSWQQAWDRSGADCAARSLIVSVPTYLEG